jgi:RND family efflux transporter MFP subunit
MRRRSWCYIGSLLLLLSLLLSACSTLKKVESNDKAPNKVKVAVAKVTREDLSRQLEMAAEFRPYQEIKVHAKIAGFVKEILVDVGDHVRAGQLLAILEIPELAEDLDQALAAVSRNEAEVNRAREELRRAESAHEAAHLSYTRLSSVLQSRPNLVAQQEIDDAMARDRGGEAQVAGAKAGLVSAEEQVRVSKTTVSKARTLQSYSRITAPFPGVISKRYADKGAMIQAGTASQSQAMPVVELSQDDRLRLVLPVPESIVPSVRIGAPVEVRVPALGRSYQGKVARFTGKVEPATRTMETEVDVFNPALELKPGMYAYVTLSLDRRDAALAVPLQAVSSKESKSTVLAVKQHGILEECAVVLGIETPTKVEIISGLKENELVVVGSRSQLKAGQAVDPKLIVMAEVKGGN